MRLSLQSDPPFFHQVLDGLDRKEQKSYRERYRYWRSKGLEANLAHQKAFRKFAPVLPFESPSEPPRAALSSVPSPAKGYVPSQDEIDRVVNELKTQGLRDSRPEILSSAENLRRISGGQAENLPSNPFQPSALADFLPLVGKLLVVSAISALLISASLELFGYSWQGICKSVLIEIGILYLMVSSAHSRFQWLCRRATGLILTGLSFFVLHSGAANSSAQGIQVAESRATELSMLRERHKRLLADYDSLPASYVTQRQKVMQEAADVESRFTAKQSAFAGSSATSAIKRVEVSEIILRACLVVMNLLFTHASLEAIQKLLRQRKGVVYA